VQRLRLLLIACLAVVAAFPATASARAPGLARVEGAGNVDFTAAGRAQIFGELDHGRVVFEGRGNSRVITCADARPLRRCAVKRGIPGRGIEWLVYKPARIFVVSRNFRLLVEDGGSFAISITGTGSLALDGSGELTVAGAEAAAYEGEESVELAPSRRLMPRRLP
jgi:hypothetical protein